MGGLMLVGVSAAYVTLSVHRDADSDSGLGRCGVEAATLIARCRSNTTDAYIAWGEFMDTDDSFVTVRTTEGTSQIGVFRTFTIGADILAAV